MINNPNHKHTKTIFTADTIPYPIHPCHDPSFPYVSTPHDVCDGCCSHMNPTVPMEQYPSSGKMVENGFMLIDSQPYLYDNTNVQYGQKLSVSENINTRVSQRRDPSCINLAATLDMTTAITTNTTLNHFIEQVIENEYDNLNGILPVMKANILFVLKYTVKDQFGGVVHEGVSKVTSQEMRYHLTDVRDYYVNSCKHIFVTNIPAMDFDGFYTLILNTVEAYVNVIDVASHITDELNPYYQFTNNNTKIAVQHETIEGVTESDKQIMIASCEINHSLQFHANVTTRLKLSFTAFMSNLISTMNTFNIWSSLYEPTSEKISDMEIQMAEMKSMIDSLTKRVEYLEGLVFLPQIVQYTRGTEYSVGQIVWLNPGTIYQVSEVFTSNNDETLTDEEAFAEDVISGGLIRIGTSNDQSTDEEDETSEDETV